MTDLKVIVAQQARTIQQLEDNVRTFRETQRILKNLVRSLESRLAAADAQYRDLLSQFEKSQRVRAETTN